MAFLLKHLLVEVKHSRHVCLPVIAEVQHYHQDDKEQHHPRIVVTTHRTCSYDSNNEGSNGVASVIEKFPQLGARVSTSSLLAIYSVQTLVQEEADSTDKICPGRCLN